MTGSVAITAVATGVLSLAIPLFLGAAPSLGASFSANSSQSALAAYTETSSASADLPPASEHAAPPAAEVLNTISPDIANGNDGGDARRQALTEAGQDCATATSGETDGAPANVYDGGAIEGTSSDDLAEFATAVNSVRVQNCLAPIPVNNFYFDACMEARLVWMAEDPSSDPSSGWGHDGTQRSDGLPAVGCDGNLAGGSGNTSQIVAQKWWDSNPHRLSLYRPTTVGDTTHTCIAFAMTHGGVPNEPLTFVRAAAKWVDC